MGPNPAKKIKINKKKRKKRVFFKFIKIIYNLVILFIYNLFIL